MNDDDRPRRGADGRYHFLYCTEDVDTGDYYLGKHSTKNLDDGYQGSGDWIKLWRVLARDRLKTTPFQFFDSEHGFGRRAIRAVVDGEPVRIERPFAADRGA
jgi:hypothetical protein